MPQLACGRQAAMVDVDHDRPLGVEGGADVAPGGDAEARARPAAAHEPALGGTPHCHETLY
jgi:hypothetical protein